MNFLCNYEKETKMNAVKSRVVFEKREVEGVDLIHFIG